METFFLMSQEATPLRQSNVLTEFALFRYCGSSLDIGGKICSLHQRLTLRWQPKSGWKAFSRYRTRPFTWLLTLGFFSTVYLQRGSSWESLTCKFHNKTQKISWQKMFSFLGNSSTCWRCTSFNFYVTRPCFCSFFCFSFPSCLFWAVGQFFKKQSMAGSPTLVLGGQRHSTCQITQMFKNYLWTGHGF